MATNINITESVIHKANFGCQKSPVESEVRSDGPSPAIPRDPELFYPESGKKNPEILIISNSNFPENPLLGYKQDAKKLEEMWTSMGITPSVMENRELHRMKKDLKDFSKKFEGDERFCAVFILSHGSYSKECGEVVFDITENSGQYMPVNDILEMFDNSRVKLQNIPKLFFFQSCRGGNKPQAIEVGAAAAAGPGGDKLPRVSDTLVMFATQQDDVAIVDADGSWLIKEIIDVFNKWSGTMHLLDLLTIVNDRVAQKIVKKSKDSKLEGVKCMSEIRSTLRKRLMLQI